MYQKKKKSGKDERGSEMDFKNSVSWQVTCCQEETMGHGRENPTTSTLQATEDAQSLADTAQEGERGSGLSVTTQLGQGTEPGAPPARLQPDRSPQHC